MFSSAPVIVAMSLFAAIIVAIIVVVILLRQKKANQTRPGDVEAATGPQHAAAAADLLTVTNPIYNDIYNDTGYNDDATRVYEELPEAPIYTEGNRSTRPPNADDLEEPIYTEGNRSTRPPNPDDLYERRPDVTCATASNSTDVTYATASDGSAQDLNESDDSTHSPGHGLSSVPQLFFSFAPPPPLCFRSFDEPGYLDVGAAADDAPPPKKTNPFGKSPRT